VTPVAYSLWDDLTVAVNGLAGRPAPVEAPPAPHAAA